MVKNKKKENKKSVKKQLEKINAIEENLVTGTLNHLDQIYLDDLMFGPSSNKTRLGLLLELQNHPVYQPVAYGLENPQYRIVTDSGKELLFNTYYDLVKFLNKNPSICLNARMSLGADIALKDTKYIGEVWGQGYLGADVMRLLSINTIKEDKVNWLRSKLNIPSKDKPIVERIKLGNLGTAPKGVFPYYSKTELTNFTSEQKWDSIVNLMDVWLSSDKYLSDAPKGLNLYGARTGRVYEAMQGNTNAPTATVDKENTLPFYPKLDTASTKSLKEVAEALSFVQKKEPRIVDGKPMTHDFTHYGEKTESPNTADKDNSFAESHITVDAKSFVAFPLLFNRPAQETDKLKISTIKSRNQVKKVELLAVDTTKRIIPDEGHFLFKKVQTSEEQLHFDHLTDEEKSIVEKVAKQLLLRGIDETNKGGVTVDFFGELNQITVADYLNSLLRSEIGLDLESFVKENNK